MTRALPKPHGSWLNGLVAAVLLLSLFSVLSTRTATAESGPVITFDDYNVGTVHNQHGWVSLGPAEIAGMKYDHFIETQSLYPSFGSKVLRISNAFTDSGFDNQTFSRPLINEAGETAADNAGLSGGQRQNYFTATWDVASAVPGSQQVGLSVAMSPTHGGASRMSYIQITDGVDGLMLNFNDVQAGAFVPTVIASGVDRTVPHNLRLTMHFIDGANNDVVQVFLDGVLIHTGTSWESYYATVPAPTPTVDSLSFYTRGTAAPATEGEGFYFDKVRLTSSAVPTSASLEVNASGENSWVTEADSTASLEFVEGPGTPPLGIGSVRMQTGSDGNSNGRLRSTSLAGTPLANISALSYATYVTANSGCQAPFVILEVDTSGDGAWDDLLFFEPCYQTGGYGGDSVPNQGTVTLNTWQTWDALVGGWWSLNDGTFGPPLKTLTTYITANPTATISTAAAGGTRIQIGDGGAPWSNFVGHVDAVTLGVNGASTTYDFDPIPVIPDTSGPNVTNVKVSPAAAYAPANVTLTATVSDSATGGSTIASATYSIDGGPQQPMSATDGAFNEVTETVRATISGLAAGSYTICVRGTDAAANTGSDTCTTLNVAVPDTEAPEITSVTTTVNPVKVNSSTTLRAVADDSASGGSNIRSAEYRINGTGSWSALYPADGSWNSPVETATRNLTFSAPGFYEICVRARDTSNNLSAQSCITQMVIDPAGGEVQASGTYTAPRGTILSSPSYSGRATFTLNAAYPTNQSMTPQGTFQLTHAGNGLRFQSTSLQWLMLDDNNGVVRGVGKLNNQTGYTFEVTFIDNGSGTRDRIRVRIWQTVSSTVVYDTQPGRPVTANPTVPLTSGNISITE